MTITVREGTAADADRIEAVQESAIRALAPRAYSSAVVDAWATESEPVGEALAAPDRPVMVAERGGTVVGVGELRAQSVVQFGARVAGEISALYVAPKATRNGVGSAIYAALETAARAEGLGSLGVLAALNAVPFYESLGFTRGMRVSHEFGGSVSAPALEMRQEL